MHPMIEEIKFIPQSKTSKMYEDLIDIEISAHELANGNFDKESFKSDCEHIANLAAKLADQIKTQQEVK
jgi:hypothetical protein